MEVAPAAPSLSNESGAVADMDARVKRCGFARLYGEEVDYIVRKYDILLGRKSKASAVDVVLGDHMSVSRQHARIYYNFKTQQWQLEVLGKNGVAVNGVTHLPSNSHVTLHSKSLIQIGQEVSFHFLLPKAGFSGNPVIGKDASQELPVAAHRPSEGEAPGMAGGPVAGSSPAKQPQPSASPRSPLAAAPEFAGPSAHGQGSPVSGLQAHAPQPLPGALQGLLRGAGAEPRPTTGPNQFEAPGYASGAYGGGEAAAFDGQVYPRHQLPPQTDVPSADSARRLHALMANVQGLAGANPALLQSLVAQAQASWSQQQRQVDSGYPQAGAGQAPAQQAPQGLGLGALTPRQIQALQALRSQQQQQQQQYQQQYP